jgi:16S rRNA (guanine966-N2)-methyltransferase
MRIVAGVWRGRVLQAPRGDMTRPTADRVRQALFDMLLHAPWGGREAIEGAHVLDVFAGTGALGLEALSRGAAFCLFVETDAAARGAIRQNTETLAPSGDLFGRTRIHRRDATDLGPRPGGDGPPFDIAFLDPPYHQGLGERALAELTGGGWLADGAVVVFERGSDEADLAAPGFEKLDERRYGAARVFFLRWIGN